MSRHFRTIVGGRSSAYKGLKDFPHGIEILLKKAKVSPDFEASLLKDPFAAAASIDLRLQETERRILANTPQAVLRTMIRNTFVPGHHVRSFLTQKAPALLILVLASTVVLTAGGVPEGVTGDDLVLYAGEDASDRMVLLQTALEQYKTDHGVYPSTQEWTAATNPLEGYVETPYLFDPWKRKFHYEGLETSPGLIGNYRLESLGGDPEDPKDNIPCPIDPELHGFGDLD